MPLLKPYMGGIAKALSVESFGKVIVEVAKLQLLDQGAEDVSLGFGALDLVACFAVGAACVAARVVACVAALRCCLRC